MWDKGGVVVKAEEIYREMKTITEGTYNFNDQMVIIAKWVEFKLNEQKQNNWISVDDRLPEIKALEPAYNSSVRVLVFCKCGGFIGDMYYSFDKVRNKNVYRFIWNGRISPWEVTHWQPLPGAPE